MHKLIGLKLTWMSFFKKQTLKKNNKKKKTNSNNKFHLIIPQLKNFLKNLVAALLYCLFTYQHNIVESVQHTDSS